MEHNYKDVYWKIKYGRYEHTISKTLEFMGVFSCISIIIMLVLIGLTYIPNITLILILPLIIILGIVEDVLQC